MRWRWIFFWMRIYTFAKRKLDELLTGSLVTVWDENLYVGNELLKYAKRWKKEVLFNPGEDKSHFDAYIEHKGIKFLDVGINITQRSMYEVYNREVRHGRT